jgi:hypothetical protein
MRHATHMTRAALLTLALAVLAAGCEQTKSASPLSPSIAGPIEGVSIAAPPPLSPGTNQKVKDTEQPITLQFRNGESSGVRPITHTVQIATDIAFTLLTYSQSNIAPSGNGVVRVILPAKLQAPRVYYWRTRADDGANKSEWSDPIRFEVLQPIVIGVPVPLSPIGNVRVTGATTTLRVRNGVSSGPHDPLRYIFQASRDAAFSQLIANDSSGEASGETTFPVSTPLNDIVVYWRARITDGTIAGPWSAVETYRTPLAAPPPPPPGPPPGGGGPCNSGNPEQIVICERNKFQGFMSHAQLLTFVRAVASSLNRNGISPGGFGILRKTGGDNCGGYSCDVICAGNGSSQQQWDVLGDAEGAQVPKFSGPLPTIRVDLCTVQ